jgi:hypothetical protein
VARSLLARTVTVDIQLQGAAQPFTVSTDGDAWFVADEIRKMSSSGDGFAVLTLQDGSLLLVHPASTWIRLQPTPTPPLKMSASTRRANDVQDDLA